MNVGAFLGAAIALAPGSLPRPALVQAVLLLVLLLLGTGVGRLIAGQRPRNRVHIAVTAGLMMLLAAANTVWQNALREPLGMGAAPWIWIVTAFSPLLLWLTGRLIPTPARLRSTASIVDPERPRRRATAVVTAVALSCGAIALPAAATANASPAGPPRCVAAAPASTAGFAAAARNLVARWATGPTHGNLVIAIPTGSGWVDSDARAGFDRRFGADYDVLTLPYDNTASWQAFLWHRGRATDSAIAITRAVFTELQTRQRHPQVYLYGQSLGAIGADTARRYAQACGWPLAGTMLVGPPEGTVNLHSGATIVANGSDPVTRWSVATLWRPPLLPQRVRSDLPTPPWIPLASFVQTSADLLSALSFAPGHGHRYGADQVPQQ